MDVVTQERVRSLTPVQLVEYMLEAQEHRRRVEMGLCPTESEGYRIEMQYS